METKYTLLTEKEAIWAQMLMEVLKDNNIPCVSQPVYGAGLTLKTGIQERLKVYIPSDNLTAAEELLQSLFSESNTSEEGSCPATEKGNRQT